MEIPINKNEDIYTLYTNAQSDEEKIEIVADYIFKLSKEDINEKDDLINEEIDDLYFDTISKLRKEIIEENSNINKYKLYKAYRLPSKENYDFKKFHERDYYAEDLMRMQLKIKEQEKELSLIDRGIILSSLEFREFSEGNGLFYNKKKIGYKVFLKFKKLWKFQNVQNVKKVEIPIYEKLKDFKENYLSDFTNQSENNFYQYLKIILNKYSEFITSQYDEDNEYRDELIKLELSVLEKLELIIPSDAYLILFNDLWGNYCNEDDEAIFENPNLFCDIIDFDWTEDSKHLIYRFFEIKKLEKDLRVQQQEFTLKYLKIVRYIEDEKKEIEKNIKQPQQFQNSVNSLKQFQATETEPLNAKQVQKIGLLFRSGIIDYLREKNPKISNNQIAGFLDLLTAERIKQGSVGSHLSKDNNKYPIQNQQDKDDLDLMLKRFGINPQSE